MTRSLEEAREANRVAQKRWRERHPADAKAMQQLKNWKARRRKLAAGWVPMSHQESGRLGAAAAARNRS